MKCNECGAINRPGRRYCHSCGGIMEILRQTSFVRCPKCGAKMEPNATHCPLCLEPQLRENRFILHKYNAEFAKRNHTGYFDNRIATHGALIIGLCVAVLFLLQTALEIRYVLSLLLGSQAIKAALNIAYYAPIDAGKRTVFVEDTKTLSLYMLTFPRRQIRTMDSAATPAEKALHVKQFDRTVTDVIKEYPTEISCKGRKRAQIPDAQVSVTYLPNWCITRVGGGPVTLRCTDPTLDLGYYPNGLNEKRHRKNIRNAFPTLIPPL